MRQGLGGHSGEFSTHANSLFLATVINALHKILTHFTDRVYQYFHIRDKNGEENDGSIN
jgi:hypothetical protein